MTGDEGEWRGVVLIDGDQKVMSKERGESRSSKWQ
jgi:hypothetical protein